MTFKIEGDKAAIDVILRKNVSSLLDVLFLDVTIGGTSQRILKMVSENSYLLSYSRPILFNIFSLPLYDYEFKFSVKQTDDHNEACFKGSIGLKKYIVGAIITAFLVFVYQTISNLTANRSFDFMLYVYIPLLAIVYFSTGYFLFRNRIKKELVYLIQ